jgi:Uma2 family endonuclease
MGIAQPEIVMRWEDDELVLSLASVQGHWTAEQYLLLTDQTNRLIEYTDGSIEVLSMPTEQHRAVVEFLFLLLRAFIDPRGGKVRFAPLRLRIRADAFREPDILLLRDANDPRRHNRYWEGADLVVEVVSPDNPERDTHVKRVDYAEAGIAEYWIVDPEQDRVSVLRLDADVYIEHGIFGRGSVATSALLQGFAVDVDAVLDAS